MVLTQISHSFDKGCFNAVDISRKKPWNSPHCGDFFFNGPVFSQVKEVKGQKISIKYHSYVFACLSWIYLSDFISYPEK